jgi:hypothetical protein
MPLKPTCPRDEAMPDAKNQTPTTDGWHDDGTAPAGPDPEDARPSTAALRRQVEAIAAERGLDGAQVVAARDMSAMPGVPPLGFAAIAAIFDCLFEADARQRDTDAPAGSRVPSSIDDV